MLTQRSDRIHSIEMSFLPPISYGGDSRSAPLQTEQCESQGNESGSGRVRPGFEANQLEALYRGAAPLAKGQWTLCAVPYYGSAANTVWTSHSLNHPAGYVTDDAVGSVAPALRWNLPASVATA